MAHGVVDILLLFGVTFKVDMDCVLQEFTAKVSEASYGGMGPPAIGR